MALDVPLPTQSVYDDADQYIPLLLSAVEGFLLSRDIWGINEYDDARLYMNDLMKFIVEYFGASAMGQTPVGALMEWVMPTPPPRWLICDGTAVLKTDYPDLFTLWAGKYGSTATHFNTPNLGGYSPMGVGSTVALDATAGSTEVALTTSQMPTHNHGVTDPGHTHVPVSPFTAIIAARPSGSSAATAGSSISGGATLAVNVTGISINNAGSGTAHNNLHPVRGVYYIVYGGKP